MSILLWALWWIIHTSQSSYHLKLVSGTWQWAHCISMAFSHQISIQCRLWPILTWWHHAIAAEFWAAHPRCKSAHVQLTILQQLHDAIISIRTKIWGKQPIPCWKWSVRHVNMSRICVLQWQYNDPSHTERKISFYNCILLIKKKNKKNKCK